MVRSALSADTTIAKAHAVFIRLALPPYTIHFKSPHYIQPTTLDLLDKKVSKETLKSTSATTASGAAVREAIGTDAKFWEEWCEVLKAAVPSLERRSFDTLHENGRGEVVDYESARGALIASHYPMLWRDLERVNDVVSIGRNVLTVGKAAQDLAAASHVEAEVFRLVHVCVRVTARGYDAEAGTQEEEKWQWVVNAYKKVLITSLQFLNNLVAQNEERKVRLWVRLFDTPASAPQEEAPAINADGDEAGEEDPRQQVVPTAPLPPAPATAPPTQPPLPFYTNDILLAYGTAGPDIRLSPLEMQAAQPLYKDETFKLIPTPALRELEKKTYQPNAWVYFVSKFKNTCIADFQKEHHRSPMLAEIHKNLPRYWWEMEQGMSAGKDKKGGSKGGKKGGGDGGDGKAGMWKLWQAKYQDAVLKYTEEMEEWYKIERERKNSGASSSRKSVLDRSQKAAVTSPANTLKIDVHEPPPTSTSQPSFEDLERELTARLKENGPATAPAGYDFTTTQDMDFNPLDPRNEDEEKDLQMVFNAEAGKKILESGKVELMRRLEGEGEGVGRRHSLSESRQGVETMAGGEDPDGSTAELLYDSVSKGGAEEARRTGRRRTSEPSVLRGHIDTEANVEDNLDEEEASDSDDSASDSSSDESYPGSSEDGRGLLTDVPLILGPSEIEVLPMLIMSGLVQTVPDPQKKWLVEPEASAPPPWAPWEESFEGQVKMKEWHSLRTHLLLSQSCGRNLLRELLIFVAAWDLREEELYFKFMLKITESILRNGLMPFAYHAFRDRSKSKDIISPAQAVLIKLLTSIFRSRNTAYLHALREAHLTTPQRLVLHPLFGPLPYTLHLARTKFVPGRADLQLMTFLFSEFRQHIIPQTCALIFLQGQVRRGRAGSEDFPLNLWDMERMYEGVYQVLEFFAGVVEEVPSGSAPPAPAEGLFGGPAHVLGGYWVEEQRRAIEKHNEREPVTVYPTPKGEVLERERRTGEWFSWKQVLGGWEMVSELVTLLRELEEGIPKVGQQMNQHQAALQKGIAPALVPGRLARTESADAAVGGSQVGAVKNGTGPAPVAVERPFDLNPPEGSTLPPLPQQLSQQSNTSSDLFEPEHPLAYPDDSTSTTNPVNRASNPPNLPLPPSPTGIHDQDEPADFEWRNLKKLTVLVLSSLVWKNKQVQDQLRTYGGLEVLLRCCREDENNPFIREHAIMCLRFAVEGNEENKAVIERLGRERGLRLVDKKATARDQGDLGEVPTEILDEEVYETYMDAGGRVGLRRRHEVNAKLFHPGQTGTALATSSSTTLPSSAATVTHGSAAANGSILASRSTVLPTRLADTEMTAEKAAELMQNALRALPLSDKMLSDRQKAEALANLDRAFEGAEKQLGTSGRR